MIVHYDFKRLRKMKKQKDIYDLFRENQHKLSQNPSSQSWQRLERRLNRRNLHSGHTSLMPIAAAILLLVGVIALLTLFANPKQADSFADNHVTPVVEDLKPAGYSPELLQAVEFCRVHCNPGADKIEEGKVGKRLVVNRQALGG